MNRNEAGLEQVTEHYDHLVDIRGMCCAQPVIQLSREMRAVNAGDVVLAVSDKDSMRKDIPAFCNQTGHELIRAEERNLLLYFWMRKG